MGGHCSSRVAAQAASPAAKNVGPQKPGLAPGYQAPDTPHSTPNGKIAVAPAAGSNLNILPAPTEGKCETQQVVEPSLSSPSTTASDVRQQASKTTSSPSATNAEVKQVVVPQALANGETAVVTIAGAWREQHFEMPTPSDRLALQVDGSDLTYSAARTLADVVSASGNTVRTLVLTFTGCFVANTDAPSDGTAPLSWARLVFSALEDLSSVRTLVLLNCSIPESDENTNPAKGSSGPCETSKFGRAVDLVAHLIRHWKKNLRELKICCSSMHCSPAECIASSLRHANELECFELSSCALSDAAVAGFIHAVTKLPKLQSVMVRWVHPAEVHTSRIREVRRKAQSDDEFDAGADASLPVVTYEAVGSRPAGSFGSKSVSEIASLVRKRETLRELKLVGFGPALTDQACSARNAERRNLGDDGARSLAAVLKDHDLMETLVLTGCNIQGPGALALADAVRTMPRVREVDLSWNGPINPEAEMALRVASRGQVTIWMPASANMQVMNPLDGEVQKCLEPTLAMITEDPQPALREKAQGEVDTHKFPLMGCFKYTKPEARKQAFLRVLDLIERGGDPNFRGKNDETLLHYAAETGDATALPRLIELGADLSACTEREIGIRESERPLEVCLRATNGDWRSIARLLISAGCTARARDVAARDEAGAGDLNGIASTEEGSIFKRCLDSC